MDNNNSINHPESIRVSLGASELSAAAGASVELVFFIANPTTQGDYFKCNILGIPPGWITYPDTPATWVPEGGQEKISIQLNPPTAAEVGAYPGRLHVFSQSDPEKRIELEFMLIVLLEEPPKELIHLRSVLTELKATPGSAVKIPLEINNPTQLTEILELSVQGVPVNWISLPSPVVTLYAGEEKRIEVILQIPSSTETRPGYFPLKISANSQKDPSIKTEIVLKLGIASFESKGRIGVMLSTVQFASAPGSSLAIPISVLNRGLENDAFRLGVEGIPLSWVSTSTQVVSLGPGENKETNLVIQPPLSPSSQAGRYKFQILIASQKTPDQVVRVDCILTLAVYSKFSTELEPKEAQAGQLISMMVKNDGNTQQVFNLICVDPEDQLVFDYLQPIKLTIQGSPAQQNASSSTGVHSATTSHAAPQNTQQPAGEPATEFTVLSIPAGESAGFRFTARPRQRRWIGGTVSYPYQVAVKSQQQEAASITGQVISRGMIPIWVLPGAIILCLALFLAAVLGFRDGAQTSSATQTLIAESTMMAGATQTIVANQTAAAIAGQMDTDGDGLTDVRENELQTNLYNPDTDGDRSWDGVEVQVGTNPLVPDTDADGLLDGSEILPCPNPMNPDTDQDGVIDGKDLDSCDANNPSLTATAASLLPTVTPVPTTAIPTQTPLVVTPSPTTASLPRFGGLILFESDRDGNPELYALDDAGHISRMTDNPAVDTQAVWDSSMQRIVFTSNRDGQNEIYLMNADGTNPVNLTNNPADDQQPAWSVDGQWVAFTSNRDGNYEVYVLQLSDLQTINLTNSPGNDSQPNWVRSTTFDASGEYILFSSDRDGNLEIYRMKTDGTEVTNLTVNPAGDQMAKGSPDGALVAFSSDRDGNPEIYTMRIDGKGLTNQTNNSAYDFGPSWAPNQSWIAFTTDRDGNQEIYIMKPDTTEVYNLTTNPYQDQVTDWE